MDNISVGLVGCGGFLRHRLQQTLDVPGVNVAAMADVDPAQIAETVERYPSLASCPTFDSIESMLENAELDAMLNCTPHKFHCDHVEQAFRQGLHVLIEKPLACSPEETDRCIAARDRSGKVGAVSYQRHGLPEFQWLRDVTRDRRYGGLLSINSILTQDWLNFTASTWRQDLDISQGGMLNDSGSHIFDILLWTTDLNPVAVNCQLNNRDCEVEIDSVSSILFDGGTIANVSVFGHAATWHERHLMTFENALLTWTDGKMEVQERGKDLQEIGNWPEATTPDANFYGAIRGECEVLAPFECAQGVVKLTAACYESARTNGATVNL